MFKYSSLLAVAMVSILTAPANATTLPITPDGTWYQFDIDPNVAQNFGSLEWIDAIDEVGYNNDGSTLEFSFTLAEPMFLKVVDAGFAGDRFEVFDNGTSLGITNFVPTTTSSKGTNFDAAFADPNWSRGVYLLAAGSHIITGNGAGLPLPFATVGAVSLAPVPVPAAFWLLASAIGGLAASQRRRA